MGDVESAPLTTLCDMLGSHVVIDGRPRRGRISDVIVHLADGYPQLVAVVVRAGRRGPSEEVRLTTGAWVDSGGLHIPSDRAPVEAGALLMPLRRDVLDINVVDVKGHRIGRVGDVPIVAADDRLVVAGVEVGVAPVLRRLGLRRLSRRLPPDILDWHALHLAGGSSHALQLSAPSAAVHRMTAGELAGLLGLLPRHRGLEVVEAIGSARAAEAIDETHPARAADLLESLPEPRAAEMLAAMETDRARAILVEMSPRRRAQILPLLAPAGRARLEPGFAHERAPRLRPRWWSIHRGHGRPNR